MTKYRLEDIELCPDKTCQDGRRLCTDGTSRVEPCPVCEGRGFRLRVDTPASDDVR